MRTANTRLSALALAAAVLVVFSSGADVVAESGVFLPDPCFSAVSSASGTVLACPAGDGEALASKGLRISVTVKDAVDVPVSGIPAADFWVIGCTDDLVLCGGSQSSGADSSTNAQGETTISGTIAAGGSDQLHVVVQGIVVGCPPTCLPIDVKSPDQNADLAVDLADAALFATGYPPLPYRSESDLNGDNVVDLLDFALFHSHFYNPSAKHQCN